MKIFWHIKIGVIKQKFDHTVCIEISIFNKVDCKMNRK